MKDVAQAADVSVQTVSAVINRKPGITEGTRCRVMAAVARLDYRPYSVARSLRTCKTRTIALIISDIANPSFSTMASAAEDYAHSFDYSLLVFNTHDDIEREARYLQTAIERWIDGILFVPAQDRMTGLDTLRAAGLPSVAIDRIPQGYAGPSVTLDNVVAGHLAAEHLLDLGHTCIGHIGGPSSLRLARERLQGFSRSLAARGLSCDPCEVDEGNWECESGYVAMQKMLARRSQLSAIFAANDRMAIGAMRAALEAGLAIPRDISFVGVDDIEVSAYQNPPLTTVRQSFAELATQGVRLLLDLVAEETPESAQMVLVPELIARQSTAPYRPR